MIDPAYEELFSETVLLAAPSSLDAYGKRSWAAPVEVQAHTEMDSRMTRDESGREVSERGRCFLFGAYEDVTVDWLLIRGSASPVILGVEHAYDEHGPHHTVLRFGNTQR